MKSEFRNQTTPSVPPASRLLSAELKERAASVYSIAPDGSSITCHICGLTSSEPQHISQKFCPRCQAFHDDRILMVRLAEGYQTHFKPCANERPLLKVAA